MKKNEKVLAEEIKGLCDESIEHNQKELDAILDNYRGSEREKIFLKGLSDILIIDRAVKEKIESYTFYDDEKDGNLLNSIQDLLEEKIILVMKLTNLRND
jgi:hypothetical protein